MAANNVNNNTKERILNHAEVLFAQKGYHAVSVREITSAAGCNLSAVNYHFGNKKNLYIEVFRIKWLNRAKRVHGAFRSALETGAEPYSPPHMIRAFAGAFVDGPLTDEERIRHFHLMQRELSNPSEAFELVLEQVIQPSLSELAGMLGPAMPKGVDREKLTLNILCTFSMILYFTFAREAVSRITGRVYDRAFKTRLVEQIVDFALKGMRLPKSAPQGAIDKEKAR
jgi:AcrR family transcriptional regulator